MGKRRKSGSKNNTNTQDIFHEFFGNFVKNSAVIEGSPEAPAVLDSALTKDSLKRMLAIHAEVIGSIEGCGFAESRFQCVRFEPESFKRCNMQFCTFNDCTFAGKEDVRDDGICSPCEPVEIDTSFHYDNIKFDHSIFINCTFESIAFDFCSFANAKFIQCRFIDCRTWGTTIELATFDNCGLANVRFCWGNFEYSHFVRCVYKNLQISVSQAPYVFGFDEQLNSGEVLYSNDERSISTDEYKAKLGELAICYLEKNEYFPAINIYQALRDRGRVLECLREGIQTYSFTCDYGRIAQLARLASTFSNLSRSELLDLLKQIQPPSRSCEGSEDALAQQNFIIHYPKIQECLLSLPGNNASIQIAIQSEAHTQEDRLALLDKVEDALESSGKHFFHSINIQHNSEIVLLIDLSFNVGDAAFVFDYISNQFISALHAIGLGIVGNAVWDGMKNASLADVVSIFTVQPKGKHVRQESHLK